MNDSGRCGMTIEGPRVPRTRSARMWRKSCKAWPLRGYRHCIHHLNADERERYRKERGEPT